MPALLMSGAAVLASAPDPGAPRTVLEVETVINGVDESVRRGCPRLSEVAPGRDHTMWIRFGEVRRIGEGWEASSTAVRCGAGPYDAWAAEAGTSSARPHLIVDLVVTAGGRGGAEATLSARKFARFDARGEAVYERTVQAGPIGAGGDSETILPLLLPDPREREAFRIQEVLLRLRTTTVEVAPPAAFGSILVRSDAPGATVLLDGGGAARISGEGPTLLPAVRAGRREIAVRDLSGRESRRSVAVEADRTVVVRVDVVSRPAVAAADLVPIGRNAEGHEEHWRVKDGGVMIVVPGGEFPMGSMEGAGEPRERPRRLVHVSTFLIDKMEVTWRQYRAYTEATGRAMPPEPIWGTPDGYAASNVLWEEAAAFCEWAGGRLPTEAEWEKAARGPEGRAYPWGEEWEPGRCNAWEGGPHRPEAAGSRPACVTPYGAVDAAGGMWEWCADWYADGYGAGAGTRDPTGPGDGTLRILRGGAWNSQRSWVRTAYRHRSLPSSRNVNNGFRCARDQAR